MSWSATWRESSPTYCPIPPPSHPHFSLDKAIQDAIDEDQVDIGDITTMATVDDAQQAVGTFLAKSEGVVAGLGVADEVFRKMVPEASVSWYCKDGQQVGKGQKLGTVTGKAGLLLKAERIALNFMQRMSGIATATSEMQRECEGTQAKIIETRKTVPGWRVLDKWAVLIGGGSNHRMGLYDMVMVKDNHVTAAGSITNAVAKCQAYIEEKGLDVPVEIETRSIDEVKELVALIDAKKANKVTRIMLDNMAYVDPSSEGGVNVEMMEQAVQIIDGRVETEASGNVTLQTVKKIAQTGVTFISCGALTHSVKALDISLKIQLV